MLSGRWEDGTFENIVLDALVVEFDKETLEHLHDLFWLAYSGVSSESCDIREEHSSLSELLCKDAVVLWVSQECVVDLRMSKAGR